MKQKCTPTPIMVCVGNISNNSGVYISDRNVVFGVSSHTKANNGFGSVDSNNLLHGNINIVYDSDYIDTPIDDRDVKIYQHQQTSSAPNETHIGFESVNVATISRNSGIFVGDVKITGLDAHAKENSAQGATYGHNNAELQNLNYVFDSDLIDAPMNDQDFKLLSR